MWSLGGDGISADFLRLSSSSPRTMDVLYILSLMLINTLLVENIPVHWSDVSPDKIIKDQTSHKFIYVVVFHFPSKEEEE